VIYRLQAAIGVERDDHQGDAGTSDEDGKDAKAYLNHAASLASFRRAISRSAASRFRPETAPTSGSTMMVVPSSVVMMER
jgi:hypothetical protein